MRKHSEKRKPESNLLLLSAIIGIVAVVGMLSLTVFSRNYHVGKPTEVLVQDIPTMLNIDLIAGSVNVEANYTIYLGDNFTAPINLYGGTPPYYMDYAECDYSVPVIDLGNSEPTGFSHNCAFTTLGNHTAQILGSDSSANTKTFLIMWNVLVVDRPLIPSTISLMATNTTPLVGQATTFFATINTTNTLSNVTLYCGDGSSQLMVAVDSPNGDFSGSCIYSSPGVYSADAVILTDKDSATSNIVSINAQPLPPPSITRITLSANPLNPNTGDPVSFIATVNTTDTISSVAIFCGDGTSHEMIEIGSTTNFAGSCVYGTAGTYTTYAVVQTSKNASTSNMVNIVVNNPPPPPTTITLSATNTTPTIGQGVGFNAFVNTTYAVTGVTLYCGDGNMQTMTGTGGAGNYGGVCTYSSAGPYLAYAVVTTSSDTTTSGSISIVVSSLPPPPVSTIALSSTNTSILVGHSTSFLAVINTTATIISVNLDCGDGNHVTMNQTIPYTYSGICTYMGVGTYSAVATLVTNINTTMSNTIAINVQPLPPPPVFTRISLVAMNATVYVGQVASFVSTVSTNANVVSVTLNCGNANTSMVFIGGNLTYAGTCTYNVPGTYTIRSTVVTDKNSNTSNAVNIIVRALPITTIILSGLNTTVHVGETSYYVAVVNTTDTINTVTLFCGDGTSSGMNPSGPSGTYRGMCVYTTAGTYHPYSAVATDKNTTNSNTVNIIVLAIPPSITTITLAGVPLNPFVGDTVNFTAIVNTTDTNILSVTLRCGNSVNNQMVQRIDGSWRGTCAYASTGVYSATAVVVTDKNTTTSGAILINVQPLPITTITLSGSPLNPFVGDAVNFTAIVNTVDNINAVTLKCGNAVNNLMVQRLDGTWRGGCTYLSASTYSATAVVSTDKGNTTSSAVSVQVSDIPLVPTAVLSSTTTTPAIDEQLNFTLRVFNYTSITNASAYLNCGNSANITMAIAGPGIYSAACTYGVEGTYNAVATVIHLTGSLTSNTLVITPASNAVNTSNVTVGLVASTTNVLAGNSIAYTAVVNGGLTPNIVMMDCGNGANVSMQFASGQYTGTCSYPVGGTYIAQASAIFAVSSVDSNSITVTISTPSGGHGGSSGGGGGGGGGGGYVPPCVPTWQCTLWSDCMNNVKTRSCTDVNKCGPLTGKPTETLACVSSTPSELTGNEQPTNENPVGSENPQTTSNQTQPPAEKPKTVNKLWILLLILGLVVIGGLLAYFYIFKPGMRSDTEQKIETWIDNQMAKGYTKEQLEKFLLEKGYSTRDVEEALKRAK